MVRHMRATSDVGRSAPARRLLPPLPALARIGERLLRRPLGQRDALETDRQPCVVIIVNMQARPLFSRRRETRSRRRHRHTMVRWRAVDAELCSIPAPAQIIAAVKPPEAVGQKFWGQETARCARAGRRAGQPRQHEMHDIVGLDRARP